MGTITHGALDYAELAARGVRPETLLDFSSNINPFGPPPSVRVALAALDPAPYPDRSCLRLREQLAACHGCGIEQVLPGNGSNELIYLIARALLRADDRVLIIGPTFGEYAHACRLMNAHVVEWCGSPECGFVVDRDAIMEQINRQRPRLVWLCAPNNPTGTSMSFGTVHALANACAEANGTLVVDCTYQAFVREQATINDWLGALPPHVLLLHSLTKSYALAGLRLGYLLGNAALLQTIGQYQPTWSVSSVAQATGLAALGDTTFLPTTLPWLWMASDMLRDGLEALGFPVWRSMLPFLLVRTGDGAATRAVLLEQGCVVRDCASFGLPEWVRVAPRRSEENAHLLRAWEETL